MNFHLTFCVWCSGNWLKTILQVQMVRGRAENLEGQNCGKSGLLFQYMMKQSVRSSYEERLFKSTVFNKVCLANTVIDCALVIER